MTTFILIVIIIGFIVYAFQQDKKKMVQSNIKSGGLKNMFPNFVFFCENIYKDTHRKMDMQLVKDDGRYLEYKVPIFRGTTAIAFIHYGIDNSIGTYAYCHAVSTKTGFVHRGYFIELNKQNWNSRVDPSYEKYFEIFDGLFTKIVESNDFYKLGIDITTDSKTNNMPLSDKEIFPQGDKELLPLDKYSDAGKLFFIAKEAIKELENSYKYLPEKGKYEAILFCLLIILQQYNERFPDKYLNTLYLVLS